MLIVNDITLVPQVHFHVEAMKIILLNVSIVRKKISSEHQMVRKCLVLVITFKLTPAENCKQDKGKKCHFIDFCFYHNTLAFFQ